jgi:hypothetical protein
MASLYVHRGHPLKLDCRQLVEIPLMGVNVYSGSRTTAAATVMIPQDPEP